MVSPSVVSPSLLVRGSGKAADIISDATTLREIEEEPHNVEQMSTAMWQLLEKIGRSKPKPEQTQYNYETLISKLQTFCESCSGPPH